MRKYLMGFVIVFCIGMYFPIECLRAGVRDYIPIVKATYPENTLKQFRDLANYFYQQGDTALSDFFVDIFQRGAWQGSGFVVVGDDGANYIITNRHVVINATSVNLEFESEDGSLSHYDNCEILYVDDKMDLAVVQFPVGQKIFRQGFPFETNFQTDATPVFSAGYPGLLGSQGWQLASGNISNSRAFPPYLSQNYPYLIQHTASIDHGNSGGPLLVKDPGSPTGYRVVGVNTWGINVQQRQNTFFSIPTVSAQDVLQKAMNSARIKKDPQLLKAELIKNCNILAAELGSEHMKGGEVKKYISYDFVAENGWTSFLELLPQGLEEVSLTSLYNDPIETMRTAIFYHFWLSLQQRAQGNLSGIRYEGINYADENDLSRLSGIRTNFDINGQKTEIVWIFEYGNWKISHLVLSSLNPGQEQKQNPEKKQKSGQSQESRPQHRADTSYAGSSKFTLGVTLGAVMPTGDLSSKTQWVSTRTTTFLEPVTEGPLANSSSGFAFGVIADYLVSNHLAIGANVLYTSLGFASDYLYKADNMESTHNFLNFGGYLKYYLSLNRKGFYLLGGGGMYTESYTIKGTEIFYISGVYYEVPFDVDESKSDFGVRVGAGYSIAISPKMGINLGGNYNKLLNTKSLDVIDNGSTKTIELSTEYFDFGVDIKMNFGS